MFIARPGPIGTESNPAQVQYTDHGTEIAVLQSELDRLATRANQIVTWMFAILSAAAVVVGALVLSLPRYCASDDCERGDISNPWFYLPLPLPALILASLVVFITIQSSLTA